MNTSLRLRVQHYLSENLGCPLITYTEVCLQLGSLYFSYEEMLTLADSVDKNSEKILLCDLPSGVLVEIFALLDVLNLIRLRTTCRFLDDTISRCASSLHRFDENCFVVVMIAERWHLRLDFYHDIDCEYVCSSEKLDFQGVKFQVDEFIAEGATSLFVFRRLTWSVQNEVLLETEKLVRLIWAHSSHPWTSLFMRLPLKLVSYVVGILPTDNIVTLKYREPAPLETSNGIDKFCYRSVLHAFPSLRGLIVEAQTPGFPGARFFSDEGVRRLNNLYVCTKNPSMLEGSSLLESRWHDMGLSASSFNLGMGTLNQLIRQWVTGTREFDEYYMFNFKAPLENYDEDELLRGLPVLRQSVRRDAFYLCHHYAFIAREDGKVLCYIYTVRREGGHLVLTTDHE